MQKVFEDLPGWTFELEEQSAGVYSLRAKDTQGCSISAIDNCIESLIERCKAEARTLSEAGRS